MNSSGALAFFGAMVVRTAMAGGAGASATARTTQREYVWRHVDKYSSVRLEEGTTRSHYRLREVGPLGARPYAAGTWPAAVL